MTTRETHHVIEDCELRFDDEAGTFEGYAARFGEPNSFNEIIVPGAFAKSIRDRTPSMFWSHRSDEPIGVWTEVQEDERGLRVRGRLVTETRRGAEALALLKAGAVRGLSIGFRAVEQERDKSGVRVLKEIDLPEISIVSLPASRNAQITSVRSDSPDAIASFTQAARRAAKTIRGKNS